MTLVDTAPAYGFGHSEEVVGKALAGRRSDFVLSTKCGIRWDVQEGALLAERDGLRILRNTRPERIAEEIETSLRRLKTDYIDIYIVHWQEISAFPCPIADTMGFLMGLKKQGKIRAIGAANLSPEQFIEYTQTGQLDLIQEKYSMLDRVVGDKFFALCKEHGVSFQAYSPLERGALTGKIKADTKLGAGSVKNNIKWFKPENLPKIAALEQKWAPLCRKYGCSMTQLVIAWTTAQGNGHNVNALCGARKIEQIEENAKGGDIVLAAADVAAMFSDAAAIS